MSFWASVKGFFSGSAGTIIEKTGEAIDRLVTSDEERLILKNEMAKIVNDEIKENHRHIEALESEVTSRHLADMKSDSWLSKNIRPLTLIFLTVAVVALAYLTVFKADVNPEALEMWIGLFTGLLMLVYGFYFGSRGIEKVMSIVSHWKSSKK